MEERVVWQTVSEEWHKMGNAVERKVLGVQQSQAVCKFCGKTEGETTFKKVAHVVPAALGNRTLFSREECDECNEVLGSRLEDDLVKLLAASRAIGRIPARGGSRKLKIGKNESSLHVDIESNTIKMNIAENEEVIEVEHLQNGTMNVSVTLQPLRPLNAAKALGRLGLFLLDRNAPGYDQILSWVKSENDWCPLPMIRFLIPGTGFNLFGVNLSYRDDEDGNRIYRVYLMCSMFMLMVPLRGNASNWPTRLALMDFSDPQVSHLSHLAQQLVIRDDGIVSDLIDTFNISYGSSTELDKS